MDIWNLAPRGYLMDIVFQLIGEFIFEIIWSRLTLVRSIFFSKFYMTTVLMENPSFGGNFRLKT